MPGSERVVGDAGGTDGAPPVVPQTAGTPPADVVLRMQDYYAQRAGYYERVYHKPERQTDLRAMEAWVEDNFADRRVLEIAAGTGWWTLHGARRAHDWLATDLNPETLAVARSKPLPGCVRFGSLDAYTLDGLAALQGEEPFDAAFAGCWWSHVPLDVLPAWMALLHAALPSGARVVFLDNSFVQTSNLPISRRDAQGNTYQRRALDDGSEHEVLKNFPTRDEAVAALGPRARNPQWIAFTHYWVLAYELA